jgi:hypothetical protein
VGEIKIPAGTWLRIRGLDYGTSAREISEHLSDCGLDIPESYISVREFKDGCTAIISITRELQCELFRWVACSKEFQNRELEIELFQSTRKAQY